MPMIDMPMEQLKNYQGRNPKPKDFDAYWERALQEMREVEANIEKHPSSFQSPYADCFDLFFTGVNEARIHVKYIRPKQIKEKSPAVIKFHGYTGNSGDWSNLLSYASLGYSVFAMDTRGQGGQSEDSSMIKGNTHHGHIIRGLDDHEDKLLFRQVYLDTVQLANIVMEMPEVDEDRVAVTGWSQGGGLALACASLEPRINKVAPVYPFLSDYQRVWEMDLARDAYEELRKYFRLFDPQHLKEKEIFTKLGYIDIQHLVDRINGEVFMATGLMDTVCPPSTQLAAYNKIKAKKELKIYPDFAHEHLPGHPDAIYHFLSTW
ncbi:alpha/beta fold hydrolase [Alkalihalobacillus trypoxylicola]|uniref:Acetylesterase n=1 Tax=Alkalihalobacillus trypoxylicola TaxID=519424 RepID=A0A162F499_9BACI|nr:alpha/beta fold hydrolase [Alkalihalobacillus trypoxylicola]KYG34778.1 acetylesterase [Alkalihalobacillus trypoxylicola]